MEKAALKKNKFFSPKGFLILIILIMVLAAFLRLWRLPEYMTFLGDEGRDALAVKRMIVDHKFRLIGPVTSIGNMYLGPLYYYLMLPAMFVSRLSPVGPAVLVALLGVATVGMVYFFGREWVGWRAALMAAFLYALSPVAIIYSRSSWNPNIMPFFALLAIFGIWRVWQQKQFWWLPIIGLALSFALQSHWLGLLLLPTIFLFWLMTLIELLKAKVSVKRFFYQTVWALLIFLFLTVAPLVWFDLRHESINFKAFVKFFTDRQATVNLRLYKALPNLWLLVKNIFTRLVAGKNEFWGGWIALIITIFLGLKLIRESLLANWHKFITRNAGLFLVLVWLLFGLLGLGNYKQHIYDHYFGFFFPVPFLLVGWVLAMIWYGRFLGKIIALFCLGFLVFLLVQTSPLRFPPSGQLQKTQIIAKFVLEKTEDKPFNLALIAERNYDEAYAFFMEVWGRSPLRIEPLQTEQTIAEQLFVICEQRPCQPVGHAKAEIAMFGWTKIAQMWKVEGVEVYKLIHNYPSNEKRN